MVQKTGLKNLGFKPKIGTTPYDKKKKLPLFQSKYLKQTKNNNKIQNEISKLLKVIDHNV